MVERLAVRMRENGGDIEGWIRLVRAYSVLNERQKALAALADAKRSLVGDAAAIARIDALARELGLAAGDPS
jgi:cytochrome c-type biogenesis protein CcmH